MDSCLQVPSTRNAEQLWGWAKSEIGKKRALTKKIKQNGYTLHLEIRSVMCIGADEN